MAPSGDQVGRAGCPEGREEPERIHEIFHAPWDWLMAVFQRGVVEINGMLNII